MNHPKTCFGVSRHHVIIPLKVEHVEELGEGCFVYIFSINHPDPSEYMQCHFKADFNERFVSSGRPLFDKYTDMRLTLSEAKELAIESIRTKRKYAMMTIDSLDEQLSKMDAEIAELEKAISNEGT